MLILSGHPSPVRTLDFSPDGTRLASGCDKEVRVWNVAEAKLWFSIPSSDTVRSIRFSPDGSSLGCVRMDQTITVWRLDPNFDMVAEFNWREGGEGAFWAMAFSPDGYALAVADIDGHVCQFHPKDWRRQSLTLTKLPSLVSSLEYSPKGSLLACASHYGFIRLTDPDWGETRLEWQAHRDWLHSVSFSPDGNRLVSAGEAGHLGIWSVKQGAADSVTSLGEFRISTARFLPDGDSILSSAWDGAVRQHSRDLVEMCRWHWELGRLNALAVSPDGMTAAVGGQVGDILIWDLP